MIERNLNAAQKWRNTEVKYLCNNIKNMSLCSKNSPHCLARMSHQNQPVGQGMEDCINLKLIEAY